MSDFKNQKEALEAADDEVKNNQERFGHSFESHPPEESSTNPLFSRYWYVTTTGKSRNFQQVEEKKLEGKSALKNKGQLVESQCFVEGMGLGSSSSASGNLVKIENLNFHKLQKTRETFRTHGFGSVDN